MVQHVVVGACRFKFFSLGCQGLLRQMLHPCMGSPRRGAQPAPSISRREAQPTRTAVFLVVEPSKIMFLVAYKILYPKKEDIVLLYNGYHSIPK